MEEFLKKYKDNMDDDFVMGYYIHLYTDYLWFKYFLPDICGENRTFMKKLNGDIVKCNGNMLQLYIYNDYTNLNVKLIDNYNLDLKTFYNKIPEMTSIIEEIPKINLIVTKIGEIIKASKDGKAIIIDIDKVTKFIKMATELILANIKEIE